MCNDPCLVIIRGVTYDFSRFEHPGGKEVIKRAAQMSKEGIDAEPMIKMYHSTTMWDSIDRKLKCMRSSIQLKTIQADGAQPNEYDYTSYKNFKRTIEQSRIQRLPSRSFWDYAFFCSMLALILISCVLSMEDGWMRLSLLLAFTCIESSLIFNLFHDGSHYALFKSARANEILSNCIGGWITWDGVKWHNHHVHSHHGFTGDTNLDVDTGVYPGPMTYTFRDVSPLILRYIMYAIFPGFMYTQSFGYAINRKPGFPYGMPKKYLIINAIKWYMIYSLGLYTGYAYMWMSSFWYWINIIGDHDQKETLKNHYDGPDWLKRQVRNSGNFMEDNVMWTRWFGGINIQIAHHVLPNYSNWQLSQIMYLLKHFCKDDDTYKFVNAPTVFHLLKSFFTRNPTLQGNFKSYVNLLNISEKSE